ncbi:MAG: sugar ABC transporter permease [Kordiimonadaceae bacterium]|jgi:multiple sugar transport system permease protein|nr:sugar ABC transporter permease [Kordiimonadaceae bacterium]MBT7604800.1 sugar ABC transporter permease [Kordiimonadaceae bacterium]MDC0111967.1 sugar ABC transporter permease [Emcibacteraceae bacterium]|tara:strand:- start:14088 stop:14960 length:873 start_codon:yes stop_codon:yes gene_type:complete
MTVSQKRAMCAWSFIGIPLIYFILIRFYPSLDAFSIAFTDWDIVGEKKYIGFDNFKVLWNDPIFWIVLSNTFEYLLLGVPISLLLSFVIAYFLDQVRFGHGFLRACYFIPFLTTAVAMAWVWRWFYQPVPVGVINLALGKVGILQLDFLRSTTEALPAVLAPAIWAGLGFQIVIFIAGLRAVPVTYYEAAKIDGATSWRILRDITLPQLRPTIVFLVVISSIGFLRIFDQVYNMTQEGEGGPLNATRPLVLNIYKLAFENFDMGMAAAQTVVLFVLLLIITIIQLRMLRK